MRMPTVYIPHGGGPCFFMEWTMGPKDTWKPLETWLKEFPQSLPKKPKALVVISAHWEESDIKVTSHPNPSLVYDYYGFPPETYQLQWPAPGQPQLAAKIVSLLSGAGYTSSVDDSRGFDHGVFIPLKVSFPKADIPTVQVALKKGLNPAEHIAIGAALAPLRDEGVLLIGSGMSYHNMRGFFTQGAYVHAHRFDTWLEQQLIQPHELRKKSLANWSEAPSARECHPREEHLLPLMVIAGASAESSARKVFSDTVMGAKISAFLFESEKI